MILIVQGINVITYILALLSFEIFTIYLFFNWFTFTLPQYQKWGPEIRCHQFLEIATDLCGIGKSVIGHMFVYKSLSILSYNNQK